MFFKSLSQKPVSQLQLHPALHPNLATSCPFYIQSLPLNPHSYCPATGHHCDSSGLLQSPPDGFHCQPAWLQSIIHHHLLSGWSFQKATLIIRGPIKTFQGLLLSESRLLTKLSPLPPTCLSSLFIHFLSHKAHAEATEHHLSLQTFSHSLAWNALSPLAVFTSLNVMSPLLLFFIPSPGRLDCYLPLFLQLSKSIYHSFKWRSVVMIVSSLSFTIIISRQHDVFRLAKPCHIVGI